MAAVGGGVFGPWIEATVPAAGEPGELGVLLLEEVDHRAHRRAHVVEVEPVEARHLLVRSALIVPTHPADEAVGLLVAPHPGWEALERAELAFARRPVADVAVERRRVGPVALDRDDVEAVPLDQLTRDRRAGAVEFASPVAG